MKRTVLGGGVLAVLVGGVFGGCEPPPKVCGAALTASAQLCTDLESLDFEQIQGPVVVGASANSAITLRNGGEADLVISSVTATGGGFRYTADWDDTPGGAIPATTIKGGKWVFLKVQFTPTAENVYTGSVTVNSNAAHLPTRTFSVRGCGVLDAGTVSCPP